MKRIKVNDVFQWEGQKVKPKDIREHISKELMCMRARGEKVIKVSDIAYKFNHTRIGIGKILAERAEEVGDIRRSRTTRAYQTAEWEFV
jgi:hypothetical protein